MLKETKELLRAKGNGRVGDERVAHNAILSNGNIIATLSPDLAEPGWCCQMWDSNPAQGKGLFCFISSNTDC